MVSSGVENIVGVDLADGSHEFIETKGGIRYYPKSKLWLIRGQVVMFDNEVASAYEKEVRELVQLIDRDREQSSRIFDDTHCFRITTEEYKEIRGQSSMMTLLRKRKTIRDLPWVFTEMGAMRLGFSFRTERAIEQSCAIVAQFVAIRQLARRNPDGLIALRAGARDPSERELADVVTSTVDKHMPVNAFPLNIGDARVLQSVAIHNVVNHGTISVEMSHDVSRWRHLDKAIIPDGGTDAVEAVEADSRLCERTKDDLRTAIREIVGEHDRGENADRDKVMEAITRIERKALGKR